MGEGIQEALTAIGDVYANSGWIAAAGTFVMIALRLFRLDAVQSALPASARWDSWPKWLHFVAPFALGAVGAIIVAVSGGMGWPMAIAGAINAGMASVALHHGTKAAGVLEFILRSKKATPTKAREALSIIVPIPREYQGPGARNLPR